MPTKRPNKEDHAAGAELTDLEDALAEPSDEGLSLEQPDGLDDLAGSGDLPYEEDEETIPFDRRIDGPSDEPAPENDADACCPISPTSIVEAILFVGDPENRPISARHIASLMRGVRSAEVDLVVGELNETYAEQDCPYRIETSAAGYRLVLLEQHAALRENFYGRVREAKLSQAAIEALATIAYNQPINRDEVKEKCTDIQRRAIAQLVRRGLVAAEKQPAKEGGMVYRTTDRFLTTFGLANLDDLPQPHDLEQN
jgi:segregation and condensation protein B